MNDASLVDENPVIFRVLLHWCLWLGAACTWRVWIHEKYHRDAGHRARFGSPVNTNTVLIYASAVAITTEITMAWIEPPAPKMRRGITNSHHTRGQDRDRRSPRKAAL